MSVEYTVLDENGEVSGSLQMAVCRDADMFPVSNLNAVKPGGFQFFERQIPTKNIYPIAVLDWLEIDPRKRRQKIGLLALKAFRVIAEEQGARIGMLRVGTGGADEDDDLESALKWRRRFYECDSWVRLENPPSDGAAIFWMYNLLPPIQTDERKLRSRLVEKPAADRYGVSPIEPEAMDALSGPEPATQ
jgi:hypothetical protein